MRSGPRLHPARGGRPCRGAGLHGDRVARSGAGTDRQAFLCSGPLRAAGRTSAAIGGPGSVARPRQSRSPERGRDRETARSASGPPGALCPRWAARDLRLPPPLVAARAARRSLAAERRRPHRCRLPGGGPVCPAPRRRRLQLALANPLGGTGGAPARAVSGTAALVRRAGRRYCPSQGRRPRRPGGGRLHRPRPTADGRRRRQHQPVEVSARRTPRPGRPVAAPGAGRATAAPVRRYRARRPAAARPGRQQ